MHLKGIILFTTAFITGTKLEPSGSNNSYRTCFNPKCVQASAAILKAMDQNADPCHDFFQYACGNFGVDNEIPNGHTRYSQFDAAERLFLARIKGLLEDDGEQFKSPDGPLRNKLNTFYRVCMNTESIGRKSQENMAKIVHRLGGFIFSLPPTSMIRNNWSINRLMTTAHFDLAIPTVLFTADYSVVFHGLLIMPPPNEDLFERVNGSRTGIERLYRRLVEAYFAGSPINSTVSKRLSEVAYFEEELLSLVQKNWSLKIENARKMNASSIQENFNFFNWTIYFDKIVGTVNGSVNLEAITVMPSVYFDSLADLMKRYLNSTTGKVTLQNYFVLRAMLFYSNSVGGPYQVVIDSARSRALSVSSKIDRSETCIRSVNRYLGDAVNSIFIGKFSSLEQKRRITKFVSQMVETFRNRMTATTWMDPKTKRLALAKIDAVKLHAAFPDELTNQTFVGEIYSAFTVTDDDFLANTQNGLKFNRFRSLSRLRKNNRTINELGWQLPVDKSSASYKLQENAILVPISHLTHPFYSEDEAQQTGNSLPIVFNFAGLGFTVGHEITHGFDSLGRQFDKAGNSFNWWSNQSDAVFHEKSLCFVRQYNAYSLAGVFEHGDLSLNENIADNGGIKVAFEAFKNATRQQEFEERLVGFENFSEDQFFFLAFANTFCEIGSKAYYRRQLTTDTHPPNRFRINGALSNFEAFASAFNCSKGRSAMNPVKKCSIW